MSALEAALWEFVEICERLGIAYAVMGGLAVRVHGIPRPTHDVDLTISLPREDLSRLFDALTARGYSVPEPYRQGWLDQVAGMPLIKIRTYLNEGLGIDVDLFLAETPFQQSMLERRVPLELDGRTAWIVSAEDLLLLKLMAYRPRDLADAADILFTQGTLDETYLRHWARQLGLTDRLEQVLANPSL